MTRPPRQRPIVSPATLARVLARTSVPRPTCSSGSRHLRLGAVSYVGAARGPGRVPRTRVADVAAAALAAVADEVGTAGGVPSNEPESRTKRKLAAREGRPTNGRIPARARRS